MNQAHGSIHCGRGVAVGHGDSRRVGRCRYADRHCVDANAGVRDGRRRRVRCQSNVQHVVDLSVHQLPDGLRVDAVVLFLVWVVF